jgi:AAA domain
MTKGEKEWQETLQAARRRWVFQSPEEQLQMAGKLTYWDDWRSVRSLPRVPEEGCTVLVVGEKQSHKTGILLHDWLTAAAKGATVLYLAAEGAHGIKTRRLPTYCERMGVPIGSLAGRWVTFANSPNLLDEDDVASFLAICEENGFRPGIVVIDTLTRASGDEDICAPQNGARIIMSMERMARAFGGATVIGVTHPPKSNKNHAIGSIQLENLAYAVLRVAKREGQVQMTVAAMKDGPAGPEQVVSFKVRTCADGEPPIVAELGLAAVEPQLALAEGQSAKERAISALAEFGAEGATATEWERKCAEAEGGPKGGAFYRAKEKAVADGSVKQEEKRFFVLAAGQGTPPPFEGSEEMPLTPPPMFYIGGGSGRSRSGVAERVASSAAT